MVHLVRNHNFGILPSQVVFRYSETPSYVNPGGIVQRLRNPTDAVYDSSGNLYVVNSGKNQILKIDPLLNIEVFAGSEDGEQGNQDGTGVNARFFNPVSICIDSSDNLFVADRGNFLIRKITPAGVVTTICGGIPGFLDGTGNLVGFNELVAIAWDPVSTDLFVIDTTKIRRVTQSGVVTTHTGTPFATLDNHGKELYGFTLTLNHLLCVIDNTLLCFSDFTNRIYKVSTSGIVEENVGYSSNIGVPRLTRDSVIDTYWEMGQPRFKIYTVDSTRIYSIQYNSNTPYPVIGKGISAIIDGDSNIAAFKDIKGITFFEGPTNSSIDDVLYVTDEHTVRKITLWPIPTVITIAGSSGQLGDSVGPGVNARFKNPGSLCFDPTTEDLYVCDIGNHRIKKIDSSNVVTNFIGTGSNGSIDGPRLNASISSPRNIVFHPSGKLYFIDGACIKECDLTSNIVTTVAGDFYHTGDNDGVGTSARFSNLGKMTVTQDGHLMVIDKSILGNSRIRKINTSTFEVTTFCGVYERKIINGNNLTSQFRNPQGIAIDSTGQIFVTDTDVNVAYIRKIDSLGNTTTFAGGNPNRNSDGVGLAAGFAWLGKIKIDLSNDELYAIDASTKIRKITPGASVTTFAGSNIAGTVNGPIATAEFENITSLAINPLNTDIAVTQGYISLYSQGSILRLISGGNVTTIPTTEIGPVVVVPPPASEYVENQLVVPSGPDQIDRNHPSVKVSCIKRIAAEAISQYDVVYINGGQVYKLDVATAPIKPFVFGIARTSGGIGDEIVVQFQGRVPYDDVPPFPIPYPTFTELFCSGSGGFSDTLPATGFRGKIGRVLGNEIEVSPVFLGTSHVEFSFELTIQNMQGTYVFTPPPLSITVSQPWIQIIGSYVYPGYGSYQNLQLDWTNYFDINWNGSSLYLHWAGDKTLYIGQNQRLTVGKVYICNYTMVP